MKQKIAKRFTYWLEVAAIGIVLGLILQGVRAWTEPGQTPPEGNLGAPINTSSNPQVKAGTLGINSDGNPIGLLVGGNAGIGTTAPNTLAPNGQPGNLDVNDVYLRSIGQWASQPCPSDFNDTGYGYCIQKTENSARPWHDASVWCATNFSARLCSASEWVNACVTGKATGMTGNWEYLDSLYDAGGYWCYSLAGGTSCGSMNSVGNDTDYPYTFRCCIENK